MINSDSRERYEEETGTMESDPEINAQIRRHFGLEETVTLSNKGSTKGINLNSLKRQLTLVLGERPGDSSTERITRRELMSRLRELETFGVNVKGYSKLDRNQMYGFYYDKVQGIVAKARKYLPESVFKEIEEYNRSVRST